MWSITSSTVPLVEESSCAIAERLYDEMETHLLGELHKPCPKCGHVRTYGEGE